MSKLGRPRALDETNKQIACAVVSMGGTIEDAAVRIGCAPRTINRHLRRDEQFREEFQAARLQGATVPFELIHRAAEKNWRSSAWLLDRLHPVEYDQLQSIQESRRQAETKFDRMLRRRLLKALQAAFAAKPLIRQTSTPDENRLKCDQNGSKAAARLPSPTPSGTCFQEVPEPKPPK